MFCGSFLWVSLGMPAHCTINTTSSFYGNTHLSNSSSFAFQVVGNALQVWRTQARLWPLGSYVTCTFIFVSVNCRWNSTNPTELLWSIIGLIICNISAACQTHSKVLCMYLLLSFDGFFIYRCSLWPNPESLRACELPIFPVGLTGEVTGDSGWKKRWRVCVHFFSAVK